MYVSSATIINSTRNIYIIVLFLHILLFIVRQVKKERRFSHSALPSPLLGNNISWHTSISDSFILRVQISHLQQSQTCQLETCLVGR
jgi:hypothetical protein